MAIEHRGFEHNFVADATETTEYRFVKCATDALEVADAAAATDVTVGIRNGIPTADTGLEVITIGQIAKLTLGSGGASIGDYLVSDSAGAGVASTTDKDWVGAIALEDGDADQVISVLVTGFTLSAT